MVESRHIFNDLRNIFDSPRRKFALQVLGFPVFSSRPESDSKLLKASIKERFTHDIPSISYVNRSLQMLAAIAMRFTLQEM